MKFTKRTAAILTASLMLVGTMTACGNSSNNEQPSGGNEDAKTYKIVADNAFAPFDFMDAETNEYTGIDMDLLAAIAEDQGFAYTIDNCGWDAALSNLGAGQCDGMIAGMTIKPERQEKFDFSDGYFEDGSILVVAKGSAIASEADLAGKTVAAKTGTVSADYTESTKDQYGFEITYFEDSPSMYQAVVSGSADACFEDFSVIGWAIKNDGTELQTVGEVVNPGYYGFAVKKGENAELIKMFNAGLKNIKESGKYDELLAKYGY